MEPFEPRWSSWAFLLYAGGLTALASGLGWLAYLSRQYGAAAYAGWALLVLAAFVAVGAGLRREHRILAGVFAFSSVVVFPVFLAALWSWFGWLNVRGASTFSGFHPGRLTVELLTIVAALAAQRAFRFPLLVLIVSLVTWLFVTDLLSGGGDWSAVVTFAVGLAFLARGISLDRGPRRPYGFWLHVAAGLTIGGSLLHFLGHGHAGWALIVVAGVLYTLLAQPFGRSSWAVLGAGGILAAAAHFAYTLSRVHVAILSASPGIHGRGWVAPLVFMLAGALLCLVGGSLARRAARAEL